MPRTRRTFTDEFKRKAVKLVKQPGAMDTHSVRDLGIEQSMLTLGEPGARRTCVPTNRCAASWLLRSNAFKGSSVGSPRSAIAKKNAWLLCKGPAVKYVFIVRRRDVCPTRAICRAMNVSVSGFYERLGRPASEHSQTDPRLTRSIQEDFEFSDRTYGSPRVWHNPMVAGKQRSINRVARLIKVANLQARRECCRLPGDAAMRLENHIAPNYLQREFGASEPNQKWVADLTYIRTAEG